MIERTIIICKPDAVARGIVGEILTRFERAGLKIVGSKMLQPSSDHYYGHYETIGTVQSRHGKKIYEDNLNYMMEGPVIAFVLEGIEAVELVRKMVGATEPKSAAPGTIRGDYAHMSYGHANSENIGIPNLIHASADPKEAQLEIAHWFSEAELFDYEPTHAHYTQAKSRKK